MAEAWTEYYSEAELAQIQRTELASLDVLSAVCKKLKIDFFLYGGSLLGAVKYGGFVPWDDDLDVAMMREDYEKLLQEGPALLPEGYVLQEPRINKRTPYPYIKLRRTDTVMVEYMYRNIKINHGVYFDIYPIDNVPDDDEELEKAHKKLMKLIRILQRRQTTSLFVPTYGWRGVVKKSLAIIKFALFRTIPHSYLISKMNKVMTKYNSLKTSRQGNLFFPRPVNYFDGVYPPEEVNFEGRKMLIPRGYKTNLSNRYGDITKEPPIERRVGHKPYILELNLEEQ